MYFLASTLLKSIRPKGDDDFVDRLNYYYTALLLGMCCVVVSAKQYVGRPIECWVPAIFTKSMEQYIEAYCWIQNTYYVPMHKNVPDDPTKRENKAISYYQWVPFVLLIQALMFTLPSIIWRLSNWQTGINLHHMIAAAIEVQGTSSLEERRQAIGTIAAGLQDVLDLQAGLTEQKHRLAHGFTLRSRFSLWRRYHGCYVTLLYLLIKMMYVLNVLLQFVLLNRFLKNDASSLYGFEASAFIVYQPNIPVLRDLLDGKEWSESGHFPRVTLCDFEVRFVANLNQYTVQCALLMNLFNEKVFAFIWVWFLILLTVTFCSMVFWWCNTTFGFQRYAFVLRYLHIAATSTSQQQHKRDKKRNRIGSARSYISPPEVYEHFVHFYLKTDGVFTLRMIANHAGDVVTMEIVKHLWQDFRQTYYFYDENENDVDSPTFSSTQQQQITAYIGADEKTRMTLLTATSCPPFQDADTPML